MLLIPVLGISLTTTWQYFFVLKLFTRVLGVLLKAVAVENNVRGCHRIPRLIPSLVSDPL